MPLKSLKIVLIYLMNLVIETLLIDNVILVRWPINP